MKRNIDWKKIILCILIVLGIFFTLNLDEVISKIIYMIIFLGTGVWILVKGLEKESTSQIILSVIPTIFPIVTKLFTKSEPIKLLTKVYNIGISFILEILGVAEIYQIGDETSITVTIGILFLVIIIFNNRVDNTAMKIRKGSEEDEFKEKNYSEKSEIFCKTLRQRLEAINREADWNENLFTPIEAEVEVCIKGKRKKKFEDLLKCLKSIKHKGAIFLVLGEPGAGKSVSLRKLCLELLDESKKTKKIPIYINLKKWNKEWNLECLPNKKDLTEFIKGILYENGDILTDGFLNKYFDKMLEDGRWYFVFDSFDEMPCLMGKQNCQELIDKISELLYQFMTGPNQSGGIIASRLYKSPSEAIGATVTLKLQEFNDIKIKTMIQKYLNNAEEIVSELFGKRENLVVLSRNPFYLSLLISYIKEKGLVFPKNQMELYSSFVEDRLEKCAGKLEREKLNREDVHNAAKKLAVFMQESAVYGLECPIVELIKGEDEEYWRKIIKLLEYAKICRIGGEKESISFVHRRFQEFFLVENIMEQKQHIGYEEYHQSIINNSGLRDALVLYCEVAEEDDVKEIAKFCWDIIQKNIVFVNNILNKGSIQLVNTLYFMTEAFRNRKDIISEFIEDFEVLVEKSLNKETDFVVLLALSNSMVLFRQEYLQKMILKVFKLKNRWLNDIVMQNCRIIDKLDGYVEEQFTIYFGNMSIRTFFERFRNIQFSLSLSKKFLYIRIVHFAIFLIGIIDIIVILIVAIFVLFYFGFYIEDVIETINQIKINGISIDIIIGSNIQNQKISNITWELDIFMFLLVSVCMILLTNTMNVLTKYWDYFCRCVALVIILTPIKEGLAIGLLMCLFIPLLITVIILFFHGIYGKIFFSGIKETKRKIILDFIFMYICPFITLWVMKSLLSLVLIIIVMVIILVLCILSIKRLVKHLKDIWWLKKQPDLRSITRVKLTENLEKLYCSKNKCIYIEELLQKKVELTGNWPDDVRPKSNNDKLERLLAELDCVKLGCCNYLF